MAVIFNSIEIPSIESGTYESVELTEAGNWYIKSVSSNYQLVGSLSEGADATFTQDGRGINCLVKTAPVTIYLQADCQNGTTIKGVYGNFFFDKLKSGNGGGSGGSYNFNAPLSESDGVVDLTTSNQLKVQNGVLTLALENNVDFMNLANSITPIEQKINNLQYQINQLKYPQFDFLEINWTPDVFKQGTFSLGEISPTASGNIPLRRGNNVATTFGTLKNADYNVNDFCYNNIEGFFFIGKNNKLINLNTNNLLNSKLTNGKYTIQFTFEIAEFGDSWKQPIYLQVNGTFSTDIGNTDYKDNSNRLEFGDTTTTTTTRALYAYNWKGGTSENRVVNLPDVAVGVKISGVAVYDGNTTTVYTRKEGQTSYIKQGTMNATPPEGGNLRAIGFIRGVNDLTCASIKIYELRFWAGAALSESEVQQLVKVSKDLS